ncbi:MAG: hypothetical protein Rhob2KO_53670 [Rhodopirellula baltica]
MFEAITSMQWTLRTMLSVAAVIAYMIAGTTTFGVAVTTTSLVTPYVGWFSYSRFAVRNQGAAKYGFAFATILLLYVSTFAVFRLVRTFPCSLAPHGDPWENIVVFSFDPNAQQLARNAYYPRIAIVPGHCVYPDKDELRKLNRAFSMDRNEYFW